jgi:hypothetical protein
VLFLLETLFQRETGSLDDPAYRLAITGAADFEETAWL